MADIYSKEKRSRIMAGIPGKETKPEILIRKFLFRNGFRFRKNDSRYPGKPDIILPKHKTVIFVNGCFWHGHECRFGKLPETNSEFWKAKIQSNKNRDEANHRKLRELGWKVIVVWQCELRNKELRDRTLQKLLQTLMEE